MSHRLRYRTLDFHSAAFPSFRDALQNGPQSSEFIRQGFIFESLRNPASKIKRGLRVGPRFPGRYAALAWICRAPLLACNRRAQAAKGRSSMREVQTEIRTMREIQEAHDKKAQRPLQ